MDIETITYENYTFTIEQEKNQIKVNMTDNTIMEIYEGFVKESDLYVKPIKKFYSMIIKALNKEQYFKFSVDTRDSKIVCTVSYNNDIMEFEEYIILSKLEARETTEILLITRIKELEKMLTPVFGYGDFGQRMIFDLDCNIIDFRPYDNYTRYTNFSDFNKFIKVTKIIMSTDSKVFTGACNTPVSEMKMNNCGCELQGDQPQLIEKAIDIINNTPTSNTYAKCFTIMCDLIKSQFYDYAIQICSCGSQYNEIQRRLGIGCGHHFNMHNGGGINYLRLNTYFIPLNHFNHPSVYLLSVSEVEVFCSLSYTNLERDFSKFESLPNLKKLSLIGQACKSVSTIIGPACKSDSTSVTPFLDIHGLISTSPNKKLKHLILKNMSEWILPETIDKAKLFAQVNNIKLEII